MDLLFKSGGNDSFHTLPDGTVKDIALHEVIGYMTGDSEEQKILKDIMVRIPTDPSDMIYRQEILKDLLANEELCKDIRSVIDSVKVLQYYGNGAKRLHDRDN
ncbi:MAG: hypothetical protein IKE92_13225, partial [Clostridiales bacterium]|nr:hypothetical protein [Clostridiales bacterium]